MGQSWLGSAARSPLLLSTKQSYVSMALALALSHCHLTLIVHPQSAELPQLLDCLNLSLPLLLLFLDEFYRRLILMTSERALECTNSVLGLEGLKIFLDFLV